MAFVFISYRREQTAGEARALHGELVRRLGAGHVFMDVDDIAPGQDFRQAVSTRLQRCDVLLVLVGQGWIDARDAGGGRRLDDASDFVRLEVATALARGIAVTPVLLQGARMPTAAELPADLRDLAWRQGIELRHGHWASDVDELVRRLGLPATAPARHGGGRRHLPALSAAVVASALAAALWFALGDRATPASTPPRPAASPPPGSEKAVAILVYELADPDPAIRRQASARLRAAHADSSEAATRALARLQALDYTRISREARIELMGFLVDSGDAAWTPALRREAAVVARRHRAAIENGQWAPGAESRRAFEAFERRFGA